MKQKEQQTSEHYKDYDLQSMNLNTITRQSECTSKKQFQSKKDKEKFQENCYNCNQQRHIAKNCYKLKKQVTVIIKTIRN